MATVLCFSTVDWDYLWHRPQAVMSSLAEDGHRILYVDTVGLRSPRTRDARRILSRLLNLARSARRGLHQPRPGVQVFSPVVLPLLNSRWVRRVNVGLLVDRLRRHLVAPSAASCAAHRGARSRPPPRGESQRRRLRVNPFPGEVMHFESRDGWPTTMPSAPPLSTSEPPIATE